VKRWQRALGSIRLQGPDIEPFREDVQYVYEYIERLENGLALVHTWKDGPSSAVAARILKGEEFE
jgi:hypothetical protein